MCGIIGYCGPKKADTVILEGLKRLEYRGYDSAGLCVGSNGALQMVKKKGKIADLRQAVPASMAGGWGIGENEVLLASDVTAILGHTKQVVYIEDGEVVVVTPEGYETTDIQNNRIKKQIDTIGWELEEIEKGSFAHFMLKEIYEQPQSIMRAMQGRIEHDNATACNGWLILSA